MATDSASTSGWLDAATVNAGGPVLNERELATAVVLTTLVVAGLVNSKTRTDLLGGFAAVGRALLNRKVIGVLLAYVAWVTLCVIGASAIGLWQFSLLKDTTLTALVVGLPLLFRALNNNTGGLLLRDVAKEALGLSAIVAFYVNLSPLPLWAEILLQMVLILLVLVQVAVQRIDPSTGQKALSGCVNFALVGVGIGLITWSTIRLLNDWPTHDQKELFLQLCLAVWLPLALFPFLYGFAYLAAVEGILLRVSRLNNEVTGARRRAYSWGFPSPFGPQRHSAVRICNSPETVPSVERRIMRATSGMTWTVVRRGRATSCRPSTHWPE